MAERVQRRESAGRPRRVNLAMKIVLELSPGSEVDAFLQNLSKDGFRLTSETQLHAGQQLKMRLARETVDCELLWVDGLEAGGVFEKQAQEPRW